MGKEITWKKDGDIDYVLEETDRSFLSMRRISWNGKPSKIDVRRWFNNEDGEKAGRGITLSDEACNELTVDLSKEGYGNTRAIIRAIKHRENFDEDLEQALKTDKDPEPEVEDEEEIDETLYDPEDIFN